MVGWKRNWECAAALAALSMAAVPAWAGCSVVKMAELGITMEDMQPITDAKINGAGVRFVVDSGAFYSVISPGNAKALKLHADPIPGWMLMGINGKTPMGLTTVKNFTIFGANLTNVTFIVAGSEVGGVGVLGQNFLSLFDIEYDLPHGAIRLMKPQDCGKTGMAYWAGQRPYSTMNIFMSDRQDPHTVGTVLLNGAKIQATFDTGAHDTILSMAAAARAGITPSSPGVEPGGDIVGFGRKLVRTWIAPFDSFKLGDNEEIRHGHIRFGEVTGDTEMLLGADFFVSHRIYVANKQHRLFLTYEGGPVFDLKTQHQDEKGVAIADVVKVATPSSAEEYSRAGAVLEAQHDRDGAIGDFEKAIAMAPTEPRYLLQRANACLDGDRKDLAAADVAKALALKPDDIDALLLHARLQLNEHGEGGPKMVADLDAVDHAADPAANERLDLGALYVTAGRPDLGIPQYDLWIRNHPDDVRRAEALNGRCWSRALAGQGLPAALADCNAALHQAPGDLAILDSRALVELRMGNLARAMQDYTAVLTKHPTAAWSLYGRGITRIRQGDGAGGKADMDAAVAIDPKLVDRAKGYGIAP